MLCHAALTRLPMNDQLYETISGDPESREQLPGPLQKLVCTAHMILENWSHSIPRVTVSRRHAAIADPKPDPCLRGAQDAVPGSSRKPCSSVQLPARTGTEQISNSKTPFSEAAAGQESKD